MQDLNVFHLYFGFLTFGFGYALILAVLGGLAGHGDSGGGDGADGGGDFHAGGDGGHDAVDFHADGSHGGGDQVDHADHSSGGLSPFSPLMVATFSTLFGGLGFITLGIFKAIPIIPQGVGNLVSLLVSASLAVICSSYFSFFLVKIFIKSETSSCISTAKLIGREAEATLDLDPGRVGEITYLLGGSRQTNMARLVDGAVPVKKGQPVEIVALTDNVMMVKPVEARESPL